MQHDVGCLLHIDEVPIHVFCPKHYHLPILSFHSILSTCIELLLLLFGNSKWRRRNSLVGLPGQWVKVSLLYVKTGKVHPVQALRLCTGRTAHWGSRGIALHFHDHGTRRGWGVSFTPRPLFTLRKTRYPLYRSLGGPQGRSGQVRKMSPQPGFDPRTV